MSSSRVTPFGRANNFFTRRRGEFGINHHAVTQLPGVVPEGTFVAAIVEALGARGKRVFVGRGIQFEMPCWAIALDRTSHEARDRWSTYVCDTTTETSWRMSDEAQRESAVRVAFNDITTADPKGGFDTLTAYRDLPPGPGDMPGDVSALLLALAAGWRADRLAEGATHGEVTTMLSLLLPPSAVALLDSNTHSPTEA